ncbi:MAG: hypothetical protein ACR2J3_13600 [Aridibacter sp.]
MPREDYKFEIKLKLIDSDNLSVFAITENSLKEIIDDFKRYLKDREESNSYRSYSVTTNPDHKFKRMGSGITIDFTKVISIDGVFKV